MVRKIRKKTAKLGISKESGYRNKSEEKEDNQKRTRIFAEYGKMAMVCKGGKKEFLAPVKKNGWAGSHFLLPCQCRNSSHDAGFPGHPQPSGREVAIYAVITRVKENCICVGI
ncbi:MAG: hypothetical protein HFI88_15065 [Lachnospiraceae bacterium]|nr:hypothetical protein [Lachnospiraceae bacterium]